MALFESPNFLYRPEIGAAASSGALRFSGYELASRLSFLIWNSLPDQTLMDQATSGMLGTADGIRTAATRMLNASAGRESVGGFAEEYLRLDRIGTQAKDPALFPEYGTNLQAAMVRDIRDTWASLAFDDQASFYDLFTTTKVVVNADLARLYGIDATGLTSTTFQTRALPAGGTAQRPADQGRSAVGVREPAIGLAHVAREVHPRIVDVYDDSAAAARRQHRGRRSADGRADDEAPEARGAHHQRLVRLVSPVHGPAGVPAGELRRDRQDTAPRTTACRSIPPAASTASPSPTPTASGSRRARASRSPSASCASTTRTPSVTRSGTVDASVLNALATAFKASGFKLRDLILAVVTNDAFSVVAPQP